MERKNINSIIFIYMNSLNVLFIIMLVGRTLS